jgi:hypothetical protein
MSFDIYLGCFRAGELATFPRKLTVDIFAPCVVTDAEFASNGLEGRHWDLDNCGYMSLDSDGEEITGFSVNRPPDNDIFWRGIITILQNTTSVLYWGTGAVVGQTATYAELPRDLIDGLGEPYLVKVPEDIFEVFRKT